MENRREDWLYKINHTLNADRPDVDLGSVENSIKVVLTTTTTENRSWTVARSTARKSIFTFYLRIHRDEARNRRFDISTSDARDPKRLILIMEWCEHLPAAAIT